MYDEYRDVGYVPLAVNLNENINIVKQYARQYTFQVLRDGGTAWGRYRMNGYIPLNYVVDTAQVVVGGMEGWNESTIRSWIAPYLGVLERRRAEQRIRDYRFAVAPSPARGPVSVRFALPEPGDAAVRVWSTDGRLVRTLNSGRADGPVSATWDLRDEAGSRVAGGLYLVRLEAAAGAAELPLTVCR
jgi:hypothetical protein